MILQIAALAYTEADRALEHAASALRLVKTIQSLPTNFLLAPNAVIPLIARAFPGAATGPTKTDLTPLTRHPPKDGARFISRR